MGHPRCWLRWEIKILLKAEGGSESLKMRSKSAVARKLAVRLYWMLRTQKPYPEIVRIESSSRLALVGAS